MQLVPVILAGGSGERLWPLSKQDYPKQFMQLPGIAFSLFQQTLQRVSDRTRYAPPLVVAGAAHRFLVAEQLAALGITDATFLAEPLARNTGAAVAFAALHAVAMQQDALLCVLPSDHHIAEPLSFSAALTHALPAAEAGQIVTLSATATTPETGYGYIRPGAASLQFPGLYPIAAFLEKPALAQAQALLAEGSVGWNCGMFILRATVALAELEAHAPALLACCRAAYAGHSVEDGRICPDAAAMQDCPAHSFDNAVMEHTARGMVIPVSMGWSDLGSFTALACNLPKDTAGNRTSGPTACHATRESCLISDGPLIATAGVEELIIVAADGAVLVASKEHAPELKPLLQQLRAQGLADTHRRREAHRPWGSFYCIDASAQHQVKRLHLKPWARISLQSHTARSEHWVVVAGRATVTKGEEQFVLERNQSTYISAGTVHRLENREPVELIVIEVQTGDYLGEDDIVRYEDNYHRA